MECIGGPAAERVSFADLARNERTPAKEKTFAFQEWFGTAAAEATAAELDDLLDDYADGVIGTYADHRARRLVVVVDTDVKRNEQFRSDLHAVRRRAPFPIVVRAGCTPRSQLESVQDKVTAGFTSDLGAIGTFIDPKSGKVAATVPRDKVDDFTRRFSSEMDDILIIEGDASRRGRYNDGEPHYGGAAISDTRVSTGTFECTAGFVVKENGTRRRGIVTTRHCAFNKGVFSGPEYMGSVYKRIGPYPKYDLLFVSSLNEDYTNKIHVDPCCPSVRRVVDERNPYASDTFCASGAATRAQCGHEVVARDARFCDSGGCTTNLVLSERYTLDPASLDGDSGGPVYKRRNNDRATALGIIVAGQNSPLLAPDFIWSHKASTIEYKLNANIRTSS